MGSYKIVFKSSVAKELRRVPNKDVSRILARISQLALEPRPVQAIKLSGEEKYRIRQSNYRILYAIADEVVTITVVKIGHRREVYR